jgi:hypothetical protein
LEPDALYAKSQVYIQRGLRAQAHKEKEEYQLWASLSLELLGKAALAKVHPALVADPIHYQSLFAACGRQLSPDIKTINAKTLFERLRHLEKAFDSRHQEFCEQMAIKRNAELHSGESPFSGIPSDNWEKEFWVTIETILSMQDQTIESWLGVEDSKAPAKIIEKAVQAIDWVVKRRMENCKAAFQKKNKDSQRHPVTSGVPKKVRWSDHNTDTVSNCNCPACGSKGVLNGSLWSEKIVSTSPGWKDPDDLEDVYIDPPLETVEKYYVAEEFHCIECGLSLYGTKEIAAAGILEEYTMTEDRVMEFGEEYGND